MKKFALAGNPNCGKTTLFNALTGSTAHVGNWPGVTVDKKEGHYKKLEEDAYIIDLPGIYSLSPYTPEEVISRNYILDENPDCIINIVDATNLERNLYLTTQLLEMDVPVIVALNMMDLLEKNGDTIDQAKLAKELGCPVVAISAVKESGIDTLMAEAYKTSLNKRTGTSVLSESSIGNLITTITNSYKSENVKHPLFHAVKLIENDEIELKDHEEYVKLIDEFKKTYNDETFGNDLEAVAADSRYKYITAHFASSKEKHSSETKATKSDKADRILTNKWLGIPIFILILFVMFHLTFSENFLYLGGLFADKAPFAEGTMFEGLFYTDAGINSPGVILQSFLTNITDKLTELANTGLTDVNAPAWLVGFICDGILAGIFSVLSFVPQILLLFAFFSILEDSGYMARVAFILDRIFRKFGLSGRAFMPMIMGFGCSVPAMINTRTLSEDNERLATIRVIPFFSCGAKLPILTAIGGGIVSYFEVGNADLITLGMYLLGMVTAIVAVVIMRNTTMRGKVPPFIMELPAYHRPGLKPLTLHVWDKGKHFVKKAFTIILASTILIWFLQSFTWSWQYIEQVDLQSIVDEVAASAEWNIEELTIGDNNIIEGLTEVQSEQFWLECYAKYNEIISAPGYLSTEDSILAGIGQLVQPFVTPLGFGSQLGRSAGWVFVVAAVTGLIAKENVIATFAVLAATVGPTILAKAAQSGDNAQIANAFADIYQASIDSEEGISAAGQMIKATGIEIPGLIAFIAFNMTTIPCFAAVSTAKAEAPQGKFASTVIFWIICSYIVSCIVYLVGSWWWTIFIVTAIAVALCFAIHYINKNIDSKKAQAI